MAVLNQTVAVVDKSGKVVSTVSQRTTFNCFICSNYSFIRRANTSSESSRKPRQPIANGKRRFKRTSSCESRRKRRLRRWNHIQLTTPARWLRQGDQSRQLAIARIPVVATPNTAMDNPFTNWTRNLVIHDIELPEHRNKKLFAVTPPTTSHIKILPQDLPQADLCRHRM